MKMKGPSFKSIAFLLAFLGLACSKYPERASEADLALEISHQVGKETLELNSDSYHNAAGQEYEVTLLEYVLSDFFLVSEHGRKVHIDTVIYLNENSDKELLLEKVPSGTYLRAGCTLGLAPEKNRSGAYGHRKQMAEMAWPDQMGGGYHFMRFEGRFKDSSEWKGFALHLGKDGNHVKASERVYIEHGKDKGKLRISMDLNEWFEGEAGLYELGRDPSYSMSNDDAMEKLAKNGTSAIKFAPSP